MLLQAKKYALVGSVVEPQKDAAREIADFLDGLKRTRLASAGLEDRSTIEENTDSLTELFDAASRWPPFNNMPASYQAALQHLIEGRREYIEEKRKLPQTLGSEVFDIARRIPASQDLLVNLMFEYGGSAIMVTFTIASMLFSAREIANCKGGKTDDAMDAVVDFVSKLNYSVFVSDWIFTAQSLLHLSI